MAPDLEPRILLTGNVFPQPFEPAWTWWLRHCQIPGTLALELPAELFTTLLTPGTMLTDGHPGFNVLFLHLEGWLPVDAVEANVLSLAHAIESAQLRRETFVCMAPCTRHPDVLERVEQDLADRLTGVAGVHVIRSSVLVALGYRHTETPSWLYSEVPLSEACCAAMATAVFRRCMAVFQPARKVIVLDCDNTLWAGQIGEDGVGGVQVLPPYQFLQTFMQQQQAQGKLLCLCSRNDAADVWNAFDQVPGMVLRREDIVACQINWASKAENLRELARSLDLSLDAFIFVDDDATECAGVEAQCPGVLVVRLPDTWTEPYLLNHWAFDSPARLTAEDALRAGTYLESQRRAEVRTRSLTLADFLESLDLDIRMQRVCQQDVPRVAQLMSRTNQMTLSGRGRSEAEVNACLQQSGMCHVGVWVQDRFGDYGLVGVMTWWVDNGHLQVIEFLLSCRALGRGVEHAMVRYLARQGLDLTFPWASTGRNHAMAAFLRSLGWDGMGPTFELPWALAQEVHPCLSAPPAGPAPREQPIAHASPWSLTSAQYHDIATNYVDYLQVLSALKAARTRVRPSLPTLYRRPATPIEALLVDIFQDVLGVDVVGADDNFFHLGGQSVLVVAVMTRVCETLQVELPLLMVYDAPSVAALTRRIEDLLMASLEPDDLRDSIAAVEALSDAEVQERLQDGLRQIAR